MPFVERRYPLILALILLLGLGFRLGYLHQASGTVFYFPLVLDSKAYEAKASEILSSPGFLPPGVFYQTPFYPYLLAFLHQLFGPTLLPIRFLQVLLGASLPILVFLISKAYFPISTSLLASLFSAFYGPLLYEEALGDKTTFAVFYFTLATLASLKAAGNRKGWLLAGFSWGVGALVRENFLLVGVVLSLVYGRKKAWLSLSGMLLAVLPLTLLNLRAGDFNLVTSQGGQNFYIGNSPYATGTYAAPPFVRQTPECEQEDFKREAEARQGRPLAPSEASRYWLQKGLDFVRTNPGKAALLYVKKALLVVSAFEVPDNFNYSFLKRYIPLLRFPLFEFGLIGPLGLCGLFFAWKGGRGKRISLLYLAILLYASTLILFFVVGRYRAPVIPLLFPFAAFAIGHLANEASQKRWKGVGLAGGLLVASFFLVNRVKVIDTKPYEAVAHFNLGNALDAQGKPAQAEAEYRQAIELNPVYAEAYNNLGNVQQQEEKYEQAIAAYRQALELKPDFPDVHFNLGNAWKKQGKYEEAMGAYRQALELEPDFAQAYNGLGIALYEQGKLAEAEAAYREAIRLSPDYALAYNNLGVALWNRGYAEEAVAAVRQAIELSPDYLNALENLALFFDARGQRKEAREYWARAQAVETRPEWMEKIKNRLAEKD